MTVEDEGERENTKRKAMLDTPVTDFELSVRARTCLKKMNIRVAGRSAADHRGRAAELQELRRERA